MQIDWFTLVAQVINFLVLVWLLKRFLYGPIVEAMDRRAAGIADKLDHARQQEEKAIAEADKLKQERMELEQAQEEMLAEARHEVDEQRHHMMEEARHEIEALQERWADAFDREREAFLGRLEERIGQEALELTRRILADLAGEEIENQAVRVFRERLEQLERQDIEALLASVRSAPEPKVQVRSAFEVPEPARAAIRKWILEMLSGDIPIRFQEDEEMVFGIELRVAGWKLAWNLETYLLDIREEMQRLLQQARWLRRASSANEELSSTVGDNAEGEV